jgi:ubiquinone/menaquinone biosynthesis C-methylase UbiE
MDDRQIKSEISEIWNTGAETYDTFVSHGIQTDEERELWIAAVSKCLPPGKGPFRVLDVGCGTGAMGLIFAGMGHRVTGIDLSERMLEQGRRKAAERNLSVTFLSGDAEDPPFPEDSFDLVVNRHLLWTLPHPERALRSWRRIVRPGGRVIVISGLWDDGGFASQLRRAISQYFGRILDPKKIETLDYSAELQTTLPYMGGISEKRARTLFAEAGFDATCSEDLVHIRRDQRSRLAWHQRIKPLGTYYLISGTKGE